MGRVMGNLDWRQQAACRDHDPDMWFPDKSETTKRANALRICRSCPVASLCADYARRSGPFFGIWGGEPQSIQAAQNHYKTPVPNAGLKPCGTLAAYRRHARRSEKPCRACLDAHYRDAERRKARQ